NFPLACDLLDERIKKYCSAQQNMLYYSQTYTSVTLTKKPPKEVVICQCRSSLKKNLQHMPTPNTTSYSKNSSAHCLRNFLKCSFRTYMTTLIFMRLSHCLRKCTRTCWKEARADSILWSRQH